MRTYYSPYPTMSDLRRAPAYEFGDAVSDALQKLHRQWADDLGIDLPSRPGGLTEPEKMAWDLLEGIEIAGARLSLNFSRLSQMLIAGGATCKDMKDYNALAMQVYQTQVQVIQLLNSVGVPGTPPVPPWPPLFIPFGTNKTSAAGSTSWDITCPADTTVIQMAPADKSRGVLPYFQDPRCVQGNEINAPVIVWFGITAFLAIVGAVGWRAVGAWGEIKSQRDSTSRINNLLLYQEKRLEWMQLQVEKCVKSGQPYAACVASAGQAVPKDLAKLLEALLADKPKPGKAWLWWLGLGLTITAVGGVIYVWKRRPSDDSWKSARFSKRERELERRERAMQNREKTG